MIEASLEARWLTERLAAAGYLVLVISASFGGQGATRSCAFAFPPKPKGGRTLSVTAYSGGGGGKKGIWRKL